ncbi:MAG: dihydrolipoamide acetyltransferase family protein [Micrococcaceae bacterium]
MVAIVTMPAVIAGDSEAALLAWLVSPGDHISAGQPLAEIETEKATVELESESEGTLAQVLVEAGRTIELGTPLAAIASPGDTDDDVQRALADAGVSASGSEGAPRAESTGSAESPQPEAAAADTVSPRNNENGPRLFASPLARKMAKDLGVTLDSLEGTGPGGRIIRADVERARDTAPASSSAPTTSTPAPAAPSAPSVPTQAAAQSTDDFEDVPLTGMRRAIARRLTESKTTVPHFYITADARMDALLDLRRQLNEQLAGQGIKATVNDLILKALGKALEATPAANVQWQGDSIRHFKSVDVAMAVATEGGLLTPVVRDVSERSLSSLTKTTLDYKERAATGKIRQPELEGGTFSLSNLGMFGVREFSAIINPPQAGILAVGQSEQRPVIVNGAVEVATMMTCTISADHRVVDGAVAAELMESFRGFIENPIALLA